MMKRHVAIILLGTVIAFGATEAQAVPITFSTTGVFSASGTNVVSFSDGSGMTTVTFNGVLDSVFTPAGAEFGDIVVTTTEPPNVLGPAVTGNFALNFSQVSPAGTGTLLSALSGNLGFNLGIATLTFATTPVTINGFTYTVNPIYTIALPGSGGGARTITTTLQGTIVGPATTVPDHGDTLVCSAVRCLALWWFSAVCDLRRVARRPRQGAKGRRWRAWPKSDSECSM